METPRDYTLVFEVPAEMRLVVSAPNFEMAKAKLPHLLHGLGWDDLRKMTVTHLVSRLVVIDEKCTVLVPAANKPIDPAEECVLLLRTAEPDPAPVDDGEIPL